MKVLSLSGSCQKFSAVGPRAGSAVPGQGVSDKLGQVSRGLQRSESLVSDRNALEVRSEEGRLQLRSCVQFLELVLLGWILLQLLLVDDHRILPQKYPEVPLRCW